MTNVNDRIRAFLYNYSKIQAEVFCVSRRRIATFLYFPSCVLAGQERKMYSPGEKGGEANKKWKGGNGHGKRQSVTGTIILSIEEIVKGNSRI